MCGKDALKDENFRRLAELFPSAVTETTDEAGRTVRAVDADALRREISVPVAEGPGERYSFTWPGKSKAAGQANSPAAKVLRPDISKSVGRDGSRGGTDSDNIYIEGDNLDALKLLRTEYANKIKLIYIDPPYNTGSDFIYGDNFSRPRRECPEDGGGRLHADWLNMLYPRLRLARELLREDGSIFVSIDYNESANLRKLMDEVFGEENFQREIIWRMGWLSGYKTAAPNFIRNHDSIMFYSKDKDRLDFRKMYIPNRDFKPLVKSSPQLREKLRELGLTARQQSGLLKFINHEGRPERYPIEDTWNCNEYDDLNSIAIVSFSGEKISKLLGVGQEFKGQKSVKMLMRILEAATSGDDIVLDFFSGTASTAHAAMQLNASDGGRRRFIMVQLPEPTAEGSAAREAGYGTICGIGEERIRRAGDRLRRDTGADIDYGFKVYRLE